MAFRNDPIVIGLRDSGAPGNVRPKPDKPNTDGGARPGPDPPGTDTGATAEECRAAYAEFRELAAKTERRWRWIAAISGAVGVGLGVAIGAWQGSRRAIAALPESE